LGDSNLVFWLLGALLTMVVLLSRYILGRFSALESQVAKDRADLIKHQDIERYMKPLETQIAQMNARLDKLLDMQIAAIKEGNKK